MREPDTSRVEGADAERAAAGREQAAAAGVSPAAASDPNKSVSPPAESEASLEEAEASVEADIAELTAERNEFRELAQRVQADFENYRKRVLREQTAVVERATQGLIEQLLPVLDSFELALESLADADEKVRKGVELVYAELLGALEKAGLERIDALGKPFDPNEHEAVAQEDGEGEPVVCEVLRSGYRLKGRVLRPATVRVTRAEA